MKAQEWVAWFDSFAVYPEDNDEWYINRIEQAATIIRDLLAENERLREESHVAQIISEMDAYFEKHQCTWRHSEAIAIKNYADRLRARFGEGEKC